MIMPEPSRGMGQPPEWPSAASSRAVAAAPGEGRRPMVWAATPVSRARPRSVRSGASQANEPS